MHIIVKIENATVRGEKRRLTTFHSINPVEVNPISHHTENLVGGRNFSAFHEDFRKLWIMGYDYITC